MVPEVPEAIAISMSERILLMKKRCEEARWTERFPRMANILRLSLGVRRYCVFAAEFRVRQVRSKKSYIYSSATNRQSGQLRRRMAFSARSNVAALPPLRIQPASARAAYQQHPVDLLPATPLLPRTFYQQHPASAAEEDNFQFRVGIFSTRRRQELAKVQRGMAARQQKALALGAPFAVAKIEAEARAQREVEALDALTPRFLPARIAAPVGYPSQHLPPTSVPPLKLPDVHAIAPGPVITTSNGSPTRRRKAGGLPSPSRAAGGSEEQLSSAVTVRAVLDIFYTKMEAEHVARRSNGPSRRRATPPLSLEQMAREYAAATEISEGSLARKIVPNGLLGLRIACAECDPHPLVHLFQRLMGWKPGPTPTSKQLDALWYLMTWLLPTRDRMDKEITRQINKWHAEDSSSSGKKMSFGAAPRYEPMPPRTTTDWEGVPKALSLLGEKRLLDRHEHYVALVGAAEALIEERSRRGARGQFKQAIRFGGAAAKAKSGMGGGFATGAVLAQAAKDVGARGGPTPPAAERKVDVDELLLHWTDHWYHYRTIFESSFVPQQSEIVRFQPVRIDREAVQRQKIARQQAQAAQVVQARVGQRHAALTQVEAERPWEGGEDVREDGFTHQGFQRVTGARASVQDEEGVRQAEEAFSAGMRQNAMEFDVVDKDQDHKLDYDEFVAFIKQREKGPHSDFQLRARFESLDADGSGQIDLHEFIRFSLRDSLKHAAARVMDLLREWDEDADGQIDRKEFRRAIKALGFGALAGKEDIDLVFDEFDESGDGLIQFNELNRMLRQSVEVDAKMLGGVKGAAALRGEKEAQLLRHDKGGKGAKGGGALKAAAAKSKKELDAGAKAACAAQALAQLRELFAASPTQVMDLFREIDTSGDGLISRPEFALAIRALGLNLPKVELTQLFKLLDPDGSGEIEYSEMRSALMGGDA